MALLEEFFQLQVTLSAFPLKFFSYADCVMDELQWSPEPLAGLR